MAVERDLCCPSNIRDLPLAYSKTFFAKRLVPSEGVEPPSATYRVAALSLSYPGPIATVREPWLIKHDDRCAPGPCMNAAIMFRTLIAGELRVREVGPRPYHFRTAHSGELRTVHDAIGDHGTRPEPPQVVHVIFPLLVQ
jgi:hypothetical protein